MKVYSNGTIVMGFFIYTKCISHPLKHLTSLGCFFIPCLIGVENIIITKKTYQNREKTTPLLSCSPFVKFCPSFELDFLIF